MDSKIVIVNQIILIRSKCKSWLLNLTLLKVDDKVTIYNSTTVFFALGFISQADENVKFLV